MSLRALQHELQEHLLGQHSCISAAIKDAPPLSTPQRLGIYRNAYQVRLIEALDDTYPMLHQLLGDEVFSSMGESFVAATPSHHRSIRWYGRELADFLAKESPYAEQPILVEIAHFEWTLAEVFDAADAKPVERSRLKSVDPDAWADLKFQFHPSIRRLALTWNAPAVWQAMSREQEPPQPELKPHAVQWLLWRQHLQNYFRSLDSIEAAALEAATAGRPFSDICAALTEYLPDEEIPLRAATLVATWTDSGMIVGLLTPLSAAP